MKRQVLVGAAAALAALGVGAQARAACKLAKVAEVPVTMRGLNPIIAANVDGHDTNFEIDTGAFFGVVSSEARDRLGLKRSVAPFGLEVRGIGGNSRSAEAARADLLTFSGMGFRNTDFLVGGRVGADDVAGVIGENLMGAFDVEYDLANGVMRYFKPEGCEKANLAYWAANKPYSRLKNDEVGQYTLRIVVPAQVNGRAIRVQLDTGSPVSFLSRRAAVRAGVEISSEGVQNAGLTYGTYGRGVETFLAPFASFKIGDEEIKNTQLRLADIDIGDTADMLLGADFFLSHRIFVSNSQKAIYFTYNGGPVFRLENRTGAAQVAASQGGAAGAADPAKAAVATAALATGSEYARRAAASAARRDLTDAIADYSKAIELEPENAGYYQSRAQVRLSNHQPVLALADLDQALKRRPDNIAALTMRAELYLQNHEVTKAKADFDAALKLAPPDGELPAKVGAAYARAGEYDEALRYLDPWIASHRKSENLAQALAARCWTRALANKGLDLALADCDEALRRDRNSTVMSYRGVVLYRMGRLDEAIGQFAQALKAQPKLAPALYGRGLAELKKGEKTQGEADIAAAVTLAPNLPRELRRSGLTADGGPPAQDKAGG